MRLLCVIKTHSQARKSRIKSRAQSRKEGEERKETTEIVGRPVAAGALCRSRCCLKLCRRPQAALQKRFIALLASFAALRAAFFFRTHAHHNRSCNPHCSALQY